MQLAVDEINAAGGVDGRPSSWSVVDDQSNPEEGRQRDRAARRGRRGRHRRDHLQRRRPGDAPAAEELQTPLFLVKAGSEAILTQDSRYTFRTCLPAAPMVAGPIAQYAQQEG